MTDHPQLTPTTETAFCAWLVQAAPEDEAEYHRGFLVLDLTPFGTPMDHEARAELARVAGLALDLAERGFIHLAQRRIGPGVFAYIAIARPQPGSRPIPLATLLPEKESQP
jgi:hypothetical protein